MNNNMKEISLNEMENIAGGRGHSSPADRRRRRMRGRKRVVARRTERTDGLDFSELKTKIQQETPDMIDPELLRELCEPTEETDYLQ